MSSGARRPVNRPTSGEGGQWPYESPFTDAPSGVPARVKSCSCEPDPPVATREPSEAGDPSSSSAGTAPDRPKPARRPPEACGTPHSVGPPSTDPGSTSGATLHHPPVEIGDVRAIDGESRRQVRDVVGGTPRPSSGARRRSLPPEANTERTARPLRHAQRVGQDPQIGDDPPTSVENSPAGGFELGLVGQAGPLHRITPPERSPWSPGSGAGAPCPSGSNGPTA